MDGLPAPNVKDFLRILFKRKWQILLFIAATTGMAWLASMYMFKDSYRASSDILLQIGREHVVDLSLVSSGAPARPVVKYDPRAQIASTRQILTGRSLIERVVQTVGYGALYPGLLDRAPDAGNPVDAAVMRLQKDLVVEPMGKGSSILQISFSHPNPDIAASVVNSAVDTFVERKVSLRQNSELTQFFSTQLEELETGLRDSEDQLQAFVVENELLGSVESEIDFLLLEMMKLDAASKQTRIDRAGATRRARKLRSQLDTGSRRGSRAPGVMSAAQYEQVKLDLLVQEREAEAFGATIQAQQEQLANYEAEITRLNALKGDYKRLTDQVKVNQDNYRLYLTKSQESKASSAMDDEGLASVNVIERAVPPSVAEGNKIPLILLVALGIGSLLGLAFAFLVEALSGTINTRADLEYALDVPILATIPDGYAIAVND